MSREILYDEVFDAQAHYRILLDSMARPGKINSLTVKDLQPPAGINRASVLVGLALLNADTSFYATGTTIATAEEITRYLIVNTSCTPAEHSAAEYIFMPGTQDAGIIREARTGSLSYPEDSATIIVDTTVISDSSIQGALVITLKGPGVEGEKEVYVSGLETSLLDAVKEQNLEFPLGIDLILTDENDRVFCIPRSNRFSYEMA